MLSGFIGCGFFETELDALSYAISLLDDPLIRSNEYMLESAINQLKEDRFYQVGRERCYCGGGTFA